MSTAAETQRFAGNGPPHLIDWALSGGAEQAVVGLVGLPLKCSLRVPQVGETVYPRAALDEWATITAVLKHLLVRLHRRDGSHYDEPCGCWLVETSQGPRIVRRYWKSSCGWRPTVNSADLLPQVLP